MTQPELFPAKEVKWNQRQVEDLVDMLLIARIWRSGATLVQMHWAKSERHLRELAEQSDGRIISGQQGYKHIQHATPDEIRHFVNWMESQGSKMIARAERTRRRAHQML